MKLLTGGIIVGSCEEGIKQILFNAYRLGSESLKRLDICKQALKLHSSSYKTVDNTLGALVNKRVLVRPKRGLDDLDPKQMDLLISIQSKRGEETINIDINSVDKVPYIIP